MCRCWVKVAVAEVLDICLLGTWALSFTLINASRITYINLRSIYGTLDLGFLQLRDRDSYTKGFMLGPADAANPHTSLPCGFSERRHPARNPSGPSKAPPIGLRKSFALGKFAFGVVECASSS